MWGGKRSHELLINIVLQRIWAFHRFEGKLFTEHLETRHRNHHPMFHSGRQGLFKIAITWTGCEQARNASIAATCKDLSAKFYFQCPPDNTIYGKARKSCFCCIYAQWKGGRNKLTATWTGLQIKWCQMNCPAVKKIIQDCFLDLILAAI